MDVSDQRGEMFLGFVVGDRGRREREGRGAERLENGRGKREGEKGRSYIFFHATKTRQVPRLAQLGRAAVAEAGTQPFS